MIRDKAANRRQLKRYQVQNHRHSIAYCRPEGWQINFPQSMTSDVAQQPCAGSSRERVLVVGASGFVGGHLFGHLSSKGIRTLGTQSTDKHAHFLRFNLVSQRILDIIPREFIAGEGPMVACICAACANVEACGRDPDATRAINVTGTIRLIDDLLERGFRILFVSTSAVHNGKLAIYDESVPADPINEYGRQKAAVEHCVLSQIPSALVIRLSKAIDLAPAPRNLFTEWERHLAESRPIQCIIDETSSPTWVADISTAIERLLSLNLSGLYHVANAERFSRESLARLFMQKVGREVPLILREAAHFGFREPRPASSCLDNQKLLRATGMRFTPIAELIDLYLASANTATPESPR
jgi:dTDP-4-dehydrorhamnose reductase